MTRFYHFMGIRQQELRTGEGRLSPKPDFKRLQYARLQDIRRRSDGDVRCGWKLALRPGQGGPCTDCTYSGDTTADPSIFILPSGGNIHEEIGHQDNRVEEWTRLLETTTTTPCHRGHGRRVKRKSWTVMGYSVCSQPRTSCLLSTG